MPQNTSHAVMAQRGTNLNALDDFPTPPWATRALLKFIINSYPLKKGTCLEPACNVGYMSKVLSKSFKKVVSTDIFDYGFGEVQDFLEAAYKPKSIDWIITNPPFKHSKEFVSKSLVIANYGVAILARTVFLEGVGRYNNLFKKNPPQIVAQFSERVPMVQGRLDSKASTATGYAWFVWIKQERKNETIIKWIPPCRKQLEEDSDYLYQS